MSWTPERLERVNIPSLPLEGQTQDQKEAYGRRELLVSGLLWAGLAGGLVGFVAVDGLEKAKSGLGLVADSSEAISRTFRVPEHGKTAGRITGYFGEKTGFGIAAIFDKLTNSMAYTPDTRRKLVEELLTNPNQANAQTLESLAASQVLLGVNYGEPIEKIRNPEDWTESQNHQIQALVDILSADIKAYLVSKKMPKNEAKKRYDEIFAQVLTNKLGIQDSPPQAARVLGLFAEAFVEKKELTDDELRFIADFTNAHINSGN